MNDLGDKLFEEMEKLEEVRRKKRLEQIKQMECFQCIWSTLRETKLYCPFKGCMKRGE